MNKNGYNSYHSGIKTCYALDIHEQVLPDSFLQTIPRSTSHSWKDLKPSRFVGSEFASQIETDLEQVKLLLDKRLKKLRITMFAFCRIYLCVITFIGRNNFYKIILQNRESVIDLVNNLPAEFDRNLVCKFLQITPHQFKIWKSNRLFQCPSSFIEYCTKRFPNQISQKEIDILKHFMSRKFFSLWNIGTVWGYAFKMALFPCLEQLGIAIVNYLAFLRSIKLKRKLENGVQ